MIDLSASKSPPKDSLWFYPNNVQIIAWKSNYIPQWDAQKRCNTVFDGVAEPLF